MLEIARITFYGNVFIFFGIPATRLVLVYQEQSYLLAVVILFFL
jgi:hypothetical protein